MQDMHLYCIFLQKDYVNMYIFRNFAEILRKFG